MMVRSIAHYDAQRNAYGKAKTDGRCPTGRKSEAAPQDAECMVYVIGSEGGSRFKVGRTKNLRKRINQLEGGAGCSLLCFAQIVATSCEASKLIEREMHKILRASGCHVTGEWFDFAEAEIRAFVDKAVAACGSAVREVRGASAGVVLAPRITDSQHNIW